MSSFVQHSINISLVTERNHDPGRGLRFDFEDNVFVISGHFVGS